MFYILSKIKKMPCLNLKIKKKRCGVKHENGQLLIELTVAIGIFVIVASVLISLILNSYVAGRLASEITIANFLAEEGLEATRSIRNNNWADITNGDHGLIISALGNWQFSGTSEIIDGKFTRIINVGETDPDRKQITSQVTWQFTEARPQEIRLITYLTNWAGPVPPYLTQLHYRWRNDDGGE